MSIRTKLTKRSSHCSLPLSLSTLYCWLHLWYPQHPPALPSRRKRTRNPSDQSSISWTVLRKPTPTSADTTAQPAGVEMSWAARRVWMHVVVIPWMSAIFLIVAPHTLDTLTRRHMPRVVMAMMLPPLLHPLLMLARAALRCLLSKGFFWKQWSAPMTLERGYKCEWPITDTSSVDEKAADTESKPEVARPFVNIIWSYD